MALRDVNVFEKHVEKIVIGAAGAGALFMVYLAIQPVTIPPPPGVHDPVTAAGPHGVEKVIHDALGDPVTITTPDQAARIEAKTDRTVEESKALIAYYGKPPVRVPPYATIYQDLAQMSPLAPSLVAAAVPRIGAANFSAQHTVITTEDHAYALRVPEPVKPEYVTAKATQYMVTTADPATIVQPLPQGAVLPTVEKKVVIIQGWIPVGQMMKEMMEVTEKKERILQDQERVAIQNIKVTRQEILPNGAKTGWTEVKEPKGETPVQPVLWGALPDDGLSSALDNLEAQFKQIVIPDYFRDAQGAMFIPPILTEPVPEKISGEMADLQAAIDALKGGYTRGPGSSGAPAAGSPLTALPTDPLQIRQLQVVPFTFWDDTVVPGHTYNYQVTAEFANPVYGWSKGLKNPADKMRAVLAADPVPVDNVHVNADVEFFVSDSSRGDGQVDVRIFKQSAGAWYHTDVRIPVGARIAGSISHAGGNINVDTHYAVVDMKATNLAGGSGHVHVVLSDPDGNLVTRDSEIDWHNPDQQKLLDAGKQAATTGPATEAAQAGRGVIMSNSSGSAIGTAAPRGGTPMSNSSGSAVSTAAPRGPTTRSIPVRPTTPRGGN